MLCVRGQKLELVKRVRVLGAGGRFWGRWVDFGAGGVDFRAGAAATGGTVPWLIGTFYLF
jgi:hypothetical protein